MSSPNVPEFANLSPLVHVILGLNPSPFTLHGTNTYLIGSGKSKILLDTGQGEPSYLPHLKTSLINSNTESISFILITHHHFDHIGGISQVFEILGKEIPLYKFHSSESDKKYLPILNNQEFKVEGATLVAIHTPGHAPDHMSFYMPQENAIFTGDCVLGYGTTVFENLKVYMDSLSVLVDFKPKRLYTGHGPVIEDGLKIIEGYIMHRNAREQEIFGVLKSGEKSVFEIVEIVYRDYPKEVWPAAENGVEQHLGKLVEEQKVAFVDGKYRVNEGVLNFKL